MKFYRIDYPVNEVEPTAVQTEWATNKREADRLARQGADGMYEANVKEVDVPTDRAGLLAFLNANIWRR